MALHVKHATGEEHDTELDARRAKLAWPHARITRGEEVIHRGGLIWELPLMGDVGKVEVHLDIDRKLFVSLHFNHPLVPLEQATRTVSVGVIALEDTRMWVLAVIVKPVLRDLIHKTLLEIDPSRSLQATATAANHAEYAMKGGLQ